jgi:hypothetical protein
MKYLVEYVLGRVRTVGVLFKVCVCVGGGGVLQLPLALGPYAPAYVFSTLILKTNLNSSGRHYHHYIQSCLIITTTIYNHVLSLPPIYTIMSYH